MKTIIAILVIFLVATTFAANTRRNSFGETSIAKSHFIKVLTNLCPKAGIEDDVELEVNQFFQCMSESSDTRNSNAPLVIPTSIRQLNKLFNFKKNKNYLLEQCPTFEERLPCAQRFAKFVHSCKTNKEPTNSPHIYFTTAMVIYYDVWGERVCGDNGKKFMAFMDETENSCRDPNFAGLYKRLTDCALVQREKEEKNGPSDKRDEVQLVTDTTICIITNYKDTCTGNLAAELFVEFLVPAQTTTIKTEKNDETDYYDY